MVGVVLLTGFLMVAGLGIYFLLELYRPFEPRTTAPKNLELEYSGPGATKNQDVTPPSSNEPTSESPTESESP